MRSVLPPTPKVPDDITMLSPALTSLRDFAADSACWKSWSVVLGCLTTTGITPQLSFILLATAAWGQSATMGCSGLYFETLLAVDPVWVGVAMTFALT